MNKRKFFLLPICLLLLAGCNANQPQSKVSEKASEAEVSSIPHEHQYGEWVETKAPTCTEKAVETRTCSCGATETRDGRDALGHDFGGEDAWIITTRPTCTEKGQESRKCSRCDATEKRDADALGHKWDDGVVTTAPTAETKGVKTFTCTRSGCTATKTEEIDKVQGIRVTFAHSAEDHFKVLVFKTKAYTTETPVETYSCYARDENGNAINFDADAALQPQISFRVVCDAGYSVGKNDIKVTGATFKNIKQGPTMQDEDPTVPDLIDETYFRITKIQGDITVTITPINGEQTMPEATFVTNHCSVVVYKSQTISDENIVAEGPFYARNKSSGEVVKTGGQLFFKVVPETGYVWNHGVTEEEAYVNTLPFIYQKSENSGNKFKPLENNVFNITKVEDNLSILINCVPEAGEAGLGYEVTFVTEHCHVLVYQTQDYEFTPTAPVDGKVLSRTKEGSAAKYVADDPATPDVDEEVKPQVSFLVVCDEGYEFNSGVAAGKDAKAANISFITGSYNKFANVGDGIYKITKIQGDLTVTIAATAKAA